MPVPVRPSSCILILTLLVVAAAGMPAVGGSRGPGAAALVAAVNAAVPCDIAIPAAVSTACATDRLPGSRAAILQFVADPHRRLIDECARGRVRVSRGVKRFDLLRALDEPLTDGAAAAAIRGFFAERPVDVASGTALSEGPYPLAFDWVVVLDRRSGTLWSFVLNCRD